MAAPELRLEVSLNLLGFRSEIRKLTNIAQSEFAPKINVKFNRQTLDAELNNLQRAIKRRVYRVEIGGNIDALPDKIKTLKEQLASLEGFKVDLGIGAVKSLSKQDAKKIKNDLRAEILGEQKKIYVPLSIKPAITRQDVRDFKNAVQSKLTGLTVKAPNELERLGQKNKGAASRAITGTGVGTVDAAKFQSMVNRATQPALKDLYAQMAKAKIPMGDVGRGTVTELRAAIMSGVPGITQDIAQGLANGLDPKLKENGSKGAKLFIDAFKDASGIASPSKVFKQIGEFSADGFEIGFINGLKDFKNKAVGEIKKIAALMKLELASVGDVRIGAGIGAIRAGVRGGTQYIAPIGPLPHGSSEPWAWNQRAFRYEPYMAQPGQERGFGVPPMRSRYPFAPAPSVMGVFNSFSPSLLGSAARALPAAGETTAMANRESVLALREFEARLRSAARSAAVFEEDATRAARRRGLEVASGQVPLGPGGPFLPPSKPPRGPISGVVRPVGGFRVAARARAARAPPRVFGPVRSGRMVIPLAASRRAAAARRVRLAGSLGGVRAVSAAAGRARVARVGVTRRDAAGRGAARGRTTRSGGDAACRRERGNRSYFFVKTVSDGA